MSSKFVVLGALVLSVLSVGVVACDDETEATPSTPTSDGGSDAVAEGGGGDAATDGSGGGDSATEASTDAATDAPQDAPADAPADAEDAG